MNNPQKAVRQTSVGTKSEGPHPIDIHVGARLKLRRMILGMSQETLGKALGLTFQQIQKYEKGVNRIGASRIFELSNLLEVPIQYFYNGYGDTDGTEHSEGSDRFMELVNSPDGVQLCRSFSEISDPKVKKRVLDLVKSIADTDRESTPA